MICFVKVMIGNGLDDTLRSEILMYDSNDLEARYNFEELVMTFLPKLCEQTYEYVYFIQKFQPIPMALNAKRKKAMVKKLAENVIL